MTCLCSTCLATVKKKKKKKKNSTVFGERIYRTPVSFLARRELCRMQILLHKRIDGVFFRFMQTASLSDRASEEKWRGHILTWWVKRKVGIHFLPMYNCLLVPTAKQSNLHLKITTLRFVIFILMIKSHWKHQFVLNHQS